MKEQTGDMILLGLICFLIGFLFLLIIFAIVDGNSIKISQETANDLCIQVTGNETAIAKDWGDYAIPKPIERGQIVCELPSFDSTHNIVVKTN